MYITGNLTSTSGQYHKDLLKVLFDALCTANAISTPAYGGSNTGDGTIGSLTATSAAVTEDWTLTCTANGPSATFSVVGSVTGAIADATSSVAFSNDVLAFTISDGSTAWETGDTISFSVTMKMGTSVWTRDRTVESTGEWVYAAHGPGDGTNQVYIGADTITDDEGGNYHNWALETLTGYAPEASDIHTSPMPGASGFNRMRCLLHNNPMQYWFNLDGFCAVGFVKVGSYYEAFYMGWLNRYGIASQYPYPAVLACSAYNISDKSDTSANHQAFYGIATQPPTLAVLNGTWQRTTAHLFPYVNATGTTSSLASRRPLGTKQQGMDIVVYTASSQQFGVMRNLKAISGYGIGPEGTVTINSVDYIVFPDVFRTTENSFIALKKE